MRRAKVTYLCCQLFGCVDSMWNVFWFMSVLFYSSLVWGVLDCGVEYIQRITRAIEMGRATRTSPYLSLSRAHCLISDS